MISKEYRNIDYTLIYGNQQQQIHFEIKHEEHNKHKDNEPLGLLLMVGSLILFSVTMILNRQLQQNTQIDSVNLFMYSSVIQIITSEIIRNFVCKQSMELFLWNKRAKELICVRQVFSVMGWVSLTYLSSVLPIGYIQLNQNAIPVVTALLGYVILSERVTKQETIALFICFCVITLTGIVKVSDSLENDQSYSITNILLCILSVLAFGVINIIGRLLKGWHFSVLCSAQFVLNFTFSFILVLLSHNSLYIIRDFHELVLIVAVGLSRSFSTLLFVRACQLAQSQRIATLNYSQAVMGYAADIILYNYSLQLIEVFAVIVILCTGAITFVESHKQHKKQQQDDIQTPLINSNEPSTKYT